jgi:hypothetical protein
MEDVAKQTHYILSTVRLARIYNWFLPAGVCS